MENIQLRVIFFLIIISLLCVPAFAGIPRKDLVSYTLDYYANEATPHATTEIREAALSSSDVATEEQPTTIAPSQEKISPKTTAVIKKEQRLAQDQRWQKVRRFLKNVRPYTKVKEEFTDNIFYDNTDEMSDFVTTTDPGIEIKNKTSKEGFDYRLISGAKIINYARNHDHNTELPYASGYARYTGKNYGLSATTNIYRSRGASGQFELNNTLSERQFIDMWLFDYGTSFETSLKKLKWGLQFYRNNTVYQKDDFVHSNRARDALAYVSSFPVTSKTNVLFDYVHGWIDTYKSKPGRWTYNKCWWGVSSAFNKLSASLKYGYRSTDPAANQKKYAGPTVKMRFDYQQTPRLIYNLELVHGLGEATLLDENVAKISGVLFGCSYLPLFNKRIRLTSSVGYKEQDTDPDTKDKYLYISLRPEYKLKKWLTVGLGYSYGARMSNITENKFINNTTDVALTAEF